MSSRKDLNICIVTSWFPSKSRPNLGSFVYHFAKNLGEAGVKVSVIAPFEEGNEMVVEQDFIKIFRVKGRFPLLSILGLIGRIKPDIVHVQAPNIFGSAAVVASKLKQIPVIATVHRAEVDELAGSMFYFRRIILSQFKKVIAVSQHTKSLAIRAGVKESKIMVIYNSCDEIRFLRKEKSILRKKHAFPLDIKIIIFVGNLIKRKNVFVLIESLRILHERKHNFLAIIIGKGEERDKLEQLVRQYELSDNVRFLGFVSDGELPEFYNSSDVFVLPSVSEGHPIVILEAMATGLPVIASDAGGNRESIDEGVNGFLFDSNNEVSLADKLEKIISSDDLQKRLSASSFNIYMQKFSTGIQIENHLKLYDSLLNNRDETSDDSAILMIDNYGLSHYTSYLAAGLAQYRSITLAGLSEKNYNITGAREKGVKFHDMSKGIPRGTSMVVTLLRPFFLFRPLRKVINESNFNVVHIHGYLPLFFALLPSLKRRGKRIIWTIHDVNPRPSSRGFRGKAELLFTKTLSQPTILRKQADNIIVHGASLKNALVGEGVDPEKIVIMPHFDYRYLRRNEVEVHHSDSKDANYILLFGMIKPYKGIEILINAARIVRQQTRKEFSILIAGRGDISYFSSMLDQEDRKYIKIRNEFIPNSEIPTIFCKAKFVVLPYTDGSQSGVLSLAYTFSKPVIASNAGSISEYVVHGQTGFIFEKGDHNSLAKYMVDLILNDEKCNEMGKRANDKLLAEMSLEKCCAITNDLYKRN